jgi:hypothetical protein
MNTTVAQRLNGNNRNGNWSTKGHRQPHIDPPPEPTFGDLFPIMGSFVRNASSRKRYRSRMCSS